MKNGHDHHGPPIPILGKKPPRVTYNFDEEFLRKMAHDIHEQSQNMGGGIPMSDPAGIMAAVVILDKLDIVMKRLNEIEHVTKHLPRMTHAEMIPPQE